MLWQLHCTLLLKCITFLFNIFTRGFEPSSKSQAATTGANAVPVAASSSNSDSKVDQLNEQRRQEDKDERRRRKEERRQEKRARKEQKRLSKSEANDLTNFPRRNRDRSRSPLPRSRERRLGDEWRPRTRSYSPTPPRERRNGPPDHSIGSDYNSFERERGRENDRRRWDLNSARRDPPRDSRRLQS